MDRRCCSTRSAAVAPAGGKFSAGYQGEVVKGEKKKGRVSDDVMPLFPL